MNNVMAKFDMDELLNCMHCGFCLPTCPTYQQTGLETFSPRGRIGLMKGVAQGKLPLDETFEKNMYACLGCRACETACPAGVRYGRLIETAREVIEDYKRATGQRSAVRRSVVRKVMFKQVFMRPKMLKAIGTVLWALQAIGLQRFADKTGLIRILPRSMAEMQEAVDKVASPRARQARQKSIAPVSVAADAAVGNGAGSVVESETRPVAGLGAASPAAEPRRTYETVWSRPLRIGMFTGCIMDLMFYETNQSTARLLAKAGCEVVFIEQEACCGALHAHSGEKSDAVSLAKRNIEAFERANVDLVVNNAGGCGAALKEYDDWLKDDAEWAYRAKRFVEKVRDISELLVDLPPLKFTKSLNARVTYQDSCHLAHGQGVRRQPRALIRSIPGVEYVELPFADSCCGSAGIYNITNFDMSMQILDDKMKHVKETKPDIVVTANPGCLLQMKKGILRAGLEDQIEAVHIVDLLNRVVD
ncbi:(Fe-S)-binding protein [Alicyclobacillus shizuokensis]|uniref:(Fe-S)-binding protein n=1 Tax=Alicyclobacillus shizuokensis TaxID=392014 RepID=UPI00082D2F8A|nr:(Fe-S)-binding protein [Alicyclobacillus shizuokensis]